MRRRRRFDGGARGELVGVDVGKVLGGMLGHEVCMIAGGVPVSGYGVNEA